MLLMSLVCPRVLSPECGTGLLRPEMFSICMLGGENAQPMRFNDNACADRARITDQYLEQATIVCMDRPARSPDLNPIEHAWDMLQTAVSSRPVQPASVQELRQALLEEWDQIPQYKIRRLISSMRRRCQAVIEARRHHTRY